VEGISPRSSSQLSALRAPDSCQHSEQLTAVSTREAVSCQHSEQSAMGGLEVAVSCDDTIRSILVIINLSLDLANGGLVGSHNCLDWCCVNDY